MRSLASFKSYATRLRKAIAVAENALGECEYKYNGNPCKRTISALEKAGRTLDVLEEKLANTNEMIDHYDFYSRCWQEEEDEAIARELYIH